jgi:DNA/RNA endonuclease YhcR with UshA esterase domain
MHQIRTIFSALLLSALVTSAAQAATPIADARQLPLGSVVTVEGSVTVPGAAYTSSSFDKGFAVQDDTAGIYVSIQSQTGLVPYQRVRVTGTLADDGFGQLVLLPGTVDRLPGAERVRPEDVATGAVGEATEGSLVVVEGEITRGPIDDLPFGYQVYINDGSGEVQIFIPASTGINPFNIPWIQVGESLEATGLSSQFLANLEVLPRSRADLRRGH